jgi:hypothetical protein
LPNLLFYSEANGDKALNIAPGVFKLTQTADPDDHDCRHRRFDNGLRGQVDAFSSPEIFLATSMLNDTLLA